MKEKKIIIILIIVNLLTIGVIYNLIKKEYLNNEKIIVKAMTQGEYENSIKSLNQSHEDYAKNIEESKTKIASAITDMGVTTSYEASPDIMSSNIRSIARDASSISYNNTKSQLTSTNVQGAVDELNDRLDNLSNASIEWKVIAQDVPFSASESPTVDISKYSFNELYIAVRNEYTSTISQIIPYIDLKDSNQNYINGYTISSSNGNTVELGVTKTTFLIRNFYTSQTRVKGTYSLYYR